MGPGDIAGPQPWFTSCQLAEVVGFLGDSHGIVDGLLGGWQVSTIAMLQTGPFLTAWLPGDASGTGTQIRTVASGLTPSETAISTTPLRAITGMRTCLAALDATQEFGIAAIFRERVLPLIHRRKTVVALLDEKDEEARKAFYRRTWNNLRWRLLFRVFFSRFAMGRLGRDPEFFRYVEGSVAERILARTEYALTVLPGYANPYMEYILTGNFRRALPLYLRPEVFPGLKRNLDKLTLFEGPIEEAALAHRGEGFDGFNLSDLFEYLDEPTSAAVYGRLLETARPGARFAYWNMLVPRRLAAAFPGRVRPLDAEARELFARDLAFFYSAFVLEEVV